MHTDTTRTQSRPHSRRHATAHPHATMRADTRCGCGCTQIHRGRAADGRRAYQCAACERVWTAGTQGRAPRHSAQRPGHQFAHTGAAKQESRA